jgi:hypothetical protein
MKPKWYFIMGSLATLSGLVGFSVVSIFFVNITVFSLRTHGPMGAIRYQQLLASFPWWAPFLVIIGLGFGIWMLKKYDFSYRKNFLFVILAFITAIIISGVCIDYLGINMVLSRQGTMRRFYQHIDSQNMQYPRGQGQGRDQGKGTLYQQNPNIQTVTEGER